MKKVLILSFAALAITLGACKKKNTTENVSVKTVAPHYPTITLTGDQYYSINTGGTAPAISATAYDSVTNEVCEVVQVAAGLNSSKPGLYPVAMTARNTDGFFSSVNAFVAVTDVPESSDITGNYRRTAGQQGIAEVTKVKRGLYYTNNMFGVDPAIAPQNMAGFYFVHIDDSTIDIPVQNTDFGQIDVSNVSFVQTPGGDTFYTYSLNANLFNPILRKFVKE
jgi:hypothetical protein